MAAHAGDEGVGAFAFDDFFDDFRRQGLDVDLIRHFPVGHNRGRIGIDEDHFHPFFTKGFAGLGAGVVEFRRLTDDDGAAADDEYFLNIFITGHNSS